METEGSQSLGASAEASDAVPEQLKNHSSDNKREFEHACLFCFVCHLYSKEGGSFLKSPAEVTIPTCLPEPSSAIFTCSVTSDTGFYEHYCCGFLASSFPLGLEQWENFLEIRAIPGTASPNQRSYFSLGNCVCRLQKLFSSRVD